MCQLAFEIEAGSIIETCNELVSSLNDLKIAIIKFTTTQCLITSDMPVMHINPAFPDSAGVENAGEFMLFPISPKIVIAVFDHNIYANCSSFILSKNEEDVKNINKYMLLSAEERIMATSSVDLNDVIIIDTSLHMMKDTLDARRKIDFCPGNIGNLLAMHSRTIPYNYALSFCGLPRDLKKIPTDCRHVFSRKYSFDERMKFLFIAYELGDLLAKNQKPNLS